MILLAQWFAKVFKHIAFLFNIYIICTTGLRLQLKSYFSAIFDRTMLYDCYLKLYYYYKKADVSVKWMRNGILIDHKAT